MTPQEADLTMRDLTDDERFALRRAAQDAARLSLAPAQQESLAGKYAPGTVVHIGRDYVRVPELPVTGPGADVDIGDIPGLG